MGCRQGLPQIAQTVKPRWNASVDGVVGVAIDRVWAVIATTKKQLLRVDTPTDGITVCPRSTRHDAIEADLATGKASSVGANVMRAPTSS